MELFSYTFSHARDPCLPEDRWLYEAVALGRERWNTVYFDSVHSVWEALVAYIRAVRVINGGADFLHLSIIMVVLESFVIMWACHMITFFVTGIVTFLLEIPRVLLSVFWMLGASLKQWIELLIAIVRLAYQIYHGVLATLEILARNFEDRRPLIPRPSQRWKSPIVQLYNPESTPVCPICRESYASLAWDISCFPDCGHTFCTPCSGSTGKCSLCALPGRPKKLFLRQ
jgi:hypothetical protein